MARRSGETPFLAGTDPGDNYDDEDSSFTKCTQANSHFRRPIKIFTSVISLLSLAICVLLIASYVLITVSPFQYKWGTQEASRDLAICLFVNFILTAPTVFLQIPILINIAVHIAMSIVILVFSTEIFVDGWPGINMCLRWDPPTAPGQPYKPLPETVECLKAKINLRIMLGVSGAFGLIIGILILVTLLLRIMALVRTKFWQGQKLGVFQGSGWNPSGFTVQFTLSVLPNERPTACIRASKAVATSSGAEEGRLIDTET